MASNKKWEDHVVKRPNKGLASKALNASESGNCNEPGCFFIGTTQQMGYCFRHYVENYGDVDVENMSAIEILERLPGLPTEEIGKARFFPKCKSQACVKITGNATRENQGYCFQCYVDKVRAREIPLLPKKKTCTTKGCTNVCLENSLGLCNSCLEDMQNGRTPRRQQASGGIESGPEFLIESIPSNQQLCDYCNNYGEQFDKLPSSAKERAIEAEEKIEQLHRNLAALEEENAVLKQQIITFKEDFKNERKDRESLEGLKNQFKDMHDNVKVDLKRAEQKLQMKEDSLRRMKEEEQKTNFKLSMVTHELEMLKTGSQGTVGQRQFNHQGWKVLYHQPQWECTHCTFKNHYSKTICEVCKRKGRPEYFNYPCGVSQHCDVPDN